VLKYNFYSPAECKVEKQVEPAKLEKVANGRIELDHFKEAMISLVELTSTSTILQPLNSLASPKMFLTVTLSPSTLA